MASILLDPNSLVEITPVTLDEDDNIKTMGLPTQVSLADLAEWILAQADDGE